MVTEIRRLRLIPQNFLHLKFSAKASRAGTDRISLHKRVRLEMFSLSVPGKRI